ncbi:hypothetical protein CONLIGDRAFT_72629 [Coniochaeta ligniaria NRRL 30616]|uniref:Uncharacterized protein n=1 Tax=Coniochaeta ligniaria NRRL 30616 TaxID=1408157 RepID=A0A1J7IBL5_9PEZI|nr:hypothetical protein CONLIGDRAFT_72629 [Coniochaeta ligniaria NRRL 30616]
MLSTREEIRSALEAYCSYIAGENRRALEILVPIIANWVPDEDWELAEDEILPQKLKFLGGLVDIPDVSPRLSDPTDLLTRYEELVPLSELDGVRRFRVLREGGPGEEPVEVLADQEYRARKFDEYAAAVEAALKERCIEEARGTIAVPEELRILSELGVDGLLGPGLQYHRSMWGCAFWAGPGEEPEKLISRVSGPVTVHGRYRTTLASWAGLEEDEWVMAGGWDTGDCIDGQWCYAMYCRRVSEEEFAWRYTVGSQYDSQVFDTIPQLLDYIKDFWETSIDQIRRDDANEESLCCWP